MGSKTKIMVFRMRELIYTGIFITLGIILVILMILEFFGCWKLSVLLA